MRQTNDSHFYLENLAQHRPLILLKIFEKEQKLLEGIWAQARRFGWKLLDLHVTRDMIPSGALPAGIIVDLLNPCPFIRDLIQQGVPAVQIGLADTPGYPVPAVVVDFKATGELAAKHLLERNFKHAAYIASDPWSNAKPIYEAFRDYSQSHGCACHLLQVADHQMPGVSPSQRCEIWGAKIVKWLEELPKPVGIFLDTDLRAARVSTLVEAAGFSVPETVAVLGRGNHVLTCETAVIPLSSIDPGLENVGRQAVNRLNAILGGKEFSAANRQLQLPPVGVVERQSTHVLAVPDPVVAQALRFIWDNLSLQVNVDHIAERLGVSRSILDRSFRRHLGRSVSAERLRKRLELSSQLLLSTQMTVSEIARRAGFPSVSYLYRAFKDRYGVTLKEYRESGKND